MRRGFFAQIGIFFLVATLPAQALSQDDEFDPQASLRTIVSAFQQCGPPAAYETVSPALFNVIAQQTGGTGCYGPIAAAGPIQSSQVMQSQDFPIGPLYVVRVTHQSGTRADWFIGFNKATRKIEYLSMQAVVGEQTASIEEGPRTGLGIEPTPPTPASPGCVKFPRMCVK